MDPVSTCKSILEKIMANYTDYFTEGKTIFDSVDIIKTKSIIVYITDANMPEEIIDEIKKYYKVIQNYS